MNIYCIINTQGRIDKETPIGRIIAVNVCEHAYGTKEEALHFLEAKFHQAQTNPLCFRVSDKIECDSFSYHYKQTLTEYENTSTWRIKRLEV